MYIFLLVVIGLIICWAGVMTEVAYEGRRPRLRNALLIIGAIHILPGLINLWILAILK
jgi:hypothetical protein